jgi:DNA-binding NtrC family response regulator
LVVEDEALVRDVLTSQLKIMGFDVDTAVDGLDGLQKYMHGHYDLVITDLVMPSMNGLDLVTHIKQVDEDAVILVLTAYPTIDTAAEAIRRGASDYIAKPFLFDDLEHRISKAIDEKVMRRQVTNVLRLVWQLVILIPLAILVGLAVAMLFR